MKRLKRNITFFLILASQYTFAQLDSVAFLFKTNPFAQFNGEMTWSIEKQIKPSYTIDATWGILNYFENASVLGNTFFINEPNSEINKASGINAALYVKKYLNKKTWLKGSYMGGGITLLNDKLYYQTNGSVTGISTDRFVEAKNLGIRYKAGYQRRWVSNSYFDLSFSTGFNLKENNQITQSINYRYKKGLTGDVQLRLITAIHAKDTQSNKANFKKDIKGSIWVNPAAFFRKGIYMGGMFRMIPQTGTFGTVEAYYYSHKSAFEDFFNNDYKIYGFQIGTRNYMNPDCQGGYAGLFAGYNHLEFTEFLHDVIITPFPIIGEMQRNIVKDQAALGLQYGYIIRSSKNVFFDIGLQNGLRYGNKPFVSSNNTTFDFPNGTYTKLLIKVGAFIQ